MNTIEEKLEKAITLSLQRGLSLQGELGKKDLQLHDEKKEWILSIIDIIDSYERAESGLLEKVGQEEPIEKAIKRFSSVKKKMVYLLERHGVKKIELPDMKLVIGWCEVTDTEPDSSRSNDEIISIERNGYLMGNEVIRAAQVIVVKN